MSWLGLGFEVEEGVWQPNCTVPPSPRQDVCVLFPGVVQLGVAVFFLFLILPAPLSVFILLLSGWGCTG